MKKIFYILVILFSFSYAFAAQGTKELQSPLGPVVIATIDGTINPATDDYVRATLEDAVERRAALYVLKLNTPGGLLNSMQTIVEELLEAPIPTVVYVSPAGGSATSAGVFITMAGHVAVMAPGTTIGAAHPVTGGGEDVQGDMRAKIENFTVSLIKAIAEQRGRNTEWAELAVRESVSITDREALEKKVIDYIATDLDSLLAQLEGRTVTVQGNPVTLTDLSKNRREPIEMTWRQKIINILSDPNIAIIIGLGALLGLGIELYHPGGILPGVLGVICLVLSLTSAQVLPLNYGGVALLILGLVFLTVEFMLPSFGIWGGAGIACFVLGSIYFVDTELVWSIDGFEVNKAAVSAVAFGVGIVLLSLIMVVSRDRKQKVQTGKQGLIDQTGVVFKEFTSTNLGRISEGKVMVMGEIWRAKLVKPESELPTKDDQIKVISVEDRMTLVVEKI